MKLLYNCNAHANNNDTGRISMRLARENSYIYQQEQTQNYL